MTKNSFVFYETFETVIEELPEDMQLKFYKVIAQYGLHGIEPKFTGIDKAIWTQIQFAIDEAQARRQRSIDNGKKGGRTAKQVNVGKPRETQKNLEEPNPNLEEPNPNLNVNVNVNANVNDNVNVNAKESAAKAALAPKASRFVKPSVSDIEAYCFERNNGINAQQFFDFYESKGWRVGNAAMKDWKACVRTWETRSRTSLPRSHPSGMAVDDSIKPGMTIM